MADPDELRAGWADLAKKWEAATARAEALPSGSVDEQVDGEWSFAQTLRHLVYATDAWLRRPVLGEPSPFWTAALPHSSLRTRRPRPSASIAARHRHGRRRSRPGPSARPWSATTSLI